MALYQSGAGLGALVGVGTTNPTSNLQVYGTPIAAGNVFSVLNTAASGNVAQFSSSVGTALIINANGNVGIGTTNSTSNLQVAGNVLTGNFISTVSIYGAIAGSNTIGASTVSATTVSATSLVGTQYGVIAGANTIACSSVTAQGTAAAGAIYLSGSQLEIGQGQTSDTSAYMDLHTAEGTYSDFSFRILRTAGANGTATWINRGSGSSYFHNQDSGDFYFQSGGVSIGAIISSGVLYFGKSNYTATTSTRPGTNIVVSYDCGTPATPVASTVYYGQNVLFSCGTLSGKMWNNSGAPSFYAGDTFVQATNCYDGTNNGTGAASQFAGNLYLDGGLSWCLGGSGTTNQCYAGAIYFRTGLSGGGLTTTTATNRMVILPNTGYVGIATNSPANTLDVYGCIRCAVNGSTTSTEGNNNSIIAYAPGGTTGNASIWMGFDPTNDCGYINSARSGQIRPVCIQTRGGNVGIGTTNPGYALQVNGDIFMGGGYQTFVFNCGNNSGRIQGVYNGGSTNPDGLNNSDIFISCNYNQQTGVRDGAGLGISQIQLVSGNGTDGKINFRTSPNGSGTLTSIPVRMTVMSTGVGIGTNTPASMLDVNGVATVTPLYIRAATSAPPWDGSSDVAQRTQTYIAFNDGGTTNDWGYLRQIGAANQYELSFDMHDDGDDCRMSWRDVQSTAAPDVVNTRMRLVNSAGLYVAGDVVAFNNFSDARLKEHVDNLENCLEKVQQLRPVEFTWKQDIRNKTKRGLRDVGLIAQEALNVFPLAHKIIKDPDTDEDIHTLKYERFVPLLIGALKDEKAKREALEERLAKLEKLLEQK
jgi:hypothetical protein